jgi:hypothetical protein
VYNGIFKKKYTKKKKNIEKRLTVCRKMIYIAIQHIMEMGTPVIRIARR